jgi:uncharacterized protein YdcH (DUF465 family)
MRNRQRLPAAPHPSHRTGLFPEEGDPAPRGLDPGRASMNRHVATERERLEREDSHFQALMEKHREFERRLDELRSRRWLSDEEQLEEGRVKKLKLAVRDEMEAMVRKASG